MDLRSSSQSLALASPAEAAACSFSEKAWIDWPVASTSCSSFCVFAVDGFRVHPSPLSEDGLTLAPARGGPAQVSRRTKTVDLV